MLPETSKHLQANNGTDILKGDISMKKIIAILFCLIILVNSVFVIVYATSNVATTTAELLSRFNLKNTQLVYGNTFNSSEMVLPLKSVSTVPTINEVSKGKWNVLCPDTSYTNGLSNQSLTDYVFTFEYTKGDTWGTRDFLFRSTSAKTNLSTLMDDVSFLRISGNTTIMKNYDGIAQTSEGLAVGTTYNIVVRSVGKDASVYIWKKDTKIPDEPNIVASSSVTPTSAGDVFISIYSTNNKIPDSIDNIRVYDLTKTDNTNKKLIYRNDFNNSDAKIPMGLSADVVDNSLKIKGQNINSKTFLVGVSDLADFQFETDYKTTADEDMSEDWIFANGGFSVRFVDGRVSIITDKKTNKAFSFNQKKTYRFLVEYKDKTANVYLWEKGTAAPQNPLLSVEVGKLTGDIKYSAVLADSIYDNINVYDLSKKEIQTELTELASWNFDDASKTIPIKSDTQLSYDDGTLNINAKNSKLITKPFFDCNYADAFWQFDYIPKNIADNKDSFILHNNTAESTSVSITILGNNIANESNNIEIISKDNGVSTLLASGSIGKLIENQQYTFRIVFLGDTVCLKFWKHLYGTPDSYNLITVVDAPKFCDGDFLIESEKGNFNIDRMTVYSGIPDFSDFDEEENIPEEAVKLVDYNFNNSTADIPFKMGEDASLAALSYSDGRLYVQTNWNSKAVFSDELGGEDIKNFVWQFDYSTTELNWNVDQFLFHVQGKDINNCLLLKIKGAGASKGGNNVFIEKNENGKTTTLAASNIPALSTGLSHKIRIQMHKSDIMVWIWPSDEATPVESTMQAVCDSEKLLKGKTYLYGYQSFYYLDNMLLYKGIPDRKLLDTKSIADQQEKLLLLDTDFSKKSDLLFETEAPSSAKVVDGHLQLITGDQHMLYGDPLLQGVEAYDLSWQFDYSSKQVQWNTEKFCVHSDGKKEGTSLYIKLLGYNNSTKKGKDNLYIIHRMGGGKEEILASTTVPLVMDTTYTIRIICKEDMIYVYYWFSGSNTPESPTLFASYNDKSVKKGKFLIQSYNSNYALDNMRIYNYAEGKQIDTVLKELPNDVCLLDCDFNGMRGKTNYPFVMNDSLSYWQNTLKIKTPDKLAVNSKNIVGDYTLSDLCLEFDVRDFEAWSINRFVIHSLDGSLDNSISLLYLGQSSTNLDNPTSQVADTEHSSLRLFQTINGESILLGKAKIELKRGKAYKVRITSSNNRIEVSIGARRTGKVEKVISAQASDALSKGMMFIGGYQSNMWLDNLYVSNVPYRSKNKYDGLLYAERK